MLASEEFEHQKVQRWLENPILKLSGSKTCLLCPIFMTLVVTTGSTKNPGESQHLPNKRSLLRKSVVSLQHYLNF